MLRIGHSATPTLRRSATTRLVSTTGPSTPQVKPISEWPITLHPHNQFKNTHASLKKTGAAVITPDLLPPEFKSWRAPFFSGLRADIDHAVTGYFENNRELKPWEKTQVTPCHDSISSVWIRAQVCLGAPDTAIIKPVPFHPAYAFSPNAWVGPHRFGPALQPFLDASVGLFIGVVPPEIADGMLLQIVIRRHLRPPGTDLKIDWHTDGGYLEHMVFYPPISQNVSTRFSIRDLDGQILHNVLSPDVPVFHNQKVEHAVFVDTHDPMKSSTRYFVSVARYGDDYINGLMY